MEKNHQILITRLRYVAINTIIDYPAHRLLHIWTVRCFDQTDIGGPKLLHFALHINR